MNCQSISTSTSKVQCVVVNNDTLIQMKLSDAKIVLGYILDGEIADSIVNVYKVRDSINTDIISMQLNQIQALQTKCANRDEKIKNLDTLLKNKDVEVADLNATIKQQKKEIRKQKIIKTLALVGDVVLPVATLLVVIFAHK